MRLKEFRKRFLYYCSVWQRIYKGGVSRSRLYKEDILVRFLRSFYIVFAQVILISLLFSNTDMYVGWSKSEAYLVVGIWNLLNYLTWSFFGTNLLYLENKVLDGTFDYILLKPLSSSWYASFSDFFIYHLPSVFSGIVLIIYYIVIEWKNIMIFNVVLGVLSILVALFIWYSIYLFFASFTISNPKNGFMSIAKELLGVTKYPMDIFGESFKTLFLTVVPISFLTTVPANILRGNATFEYLFYALLVGILLYILARYSWQKNVEKYSSASS